MMGLMCVSFLEKYISSMGEIHSNKECANF